MALFSKDQPGSAPGYIWREAGEVVDVLDEKLAEDLRKMVHAGFHEVIGHDLSEAAILDPEPEPEPEPEPDPAPVADETGPVKPARNTKA